jgi:hypothetical protein
LVLAIYQEIAELRRDGAGSHRRAAMKIRAVAIRRKPNS